MAKEIGEEYASSLSDLTVNSKPLINMLTILAEENIVHAGVIVETVEKHLEKVPSDIKLPVLYLVDSIIKNVGGDYTQKFAQSIVNMFTKTFKVVDEKTRSQMFKLRDTWHDVFPSTKLYQLDVKVNLIDPAWPIQAQPQPQQAKIHFNPNFLKKPAAPIPVPVTETKALTAEEEKMRMVLAQKEKELIMLQQKKIEMEMELKRQLNIAETSGKSGLSTSSQPASSATSTALYKNISKSAGVSRIAPVSGAMLSAVRDPRLAARMQQAAPQQPIAPNVFDIKPLERIPKVIKRKNVLTIDVTAENNTSRPENGSRDPRARREPRVVRNRNFEKRPDNKERFKTRQAKIKAEENRKKDLEKANRQYDDIDKQTDVRGKPNAFHKDDEIIEDFQSKDSMEDIFPNFPTADRKKINKLPPIPKLNRQDDSKTNHFNKSEEAAPSPTKRKKESLTRSEKKINKKRDSGKEGSDSSPEKKAKGKGRHKKQTELTNKVDEDETVPFKELKNYHKERYMRRNKEKSESPDRPAPLESADHTPAESEATNIPDLVVENMDVDLRILPPPESAAAITQKRPSTENIETKSKKHKLDKLFGSEDVDLRQLPQVEETTVTQSVEAMEDCSETTSQNDTSPKQKDWAEFKEKHTFSSAKDNPEFAVVRAKLAEATKGKDRLGRKLRFSTSVEDTDFRMNSKPEDLDTENDKETIKIIMSQAEENFKSGSMGKEQYNTLMYQIMQIHEKLKLKEAKQRESLEESKRKLHNVNPNDEASGKHLNNDNNFGDIDERITRLPYIPRDNHNMSKKELPLGDSDLRINNHMRHVQDMRMPMRPMPDVLPRPPLPPMIPGPPFPQSKWRGSRMRIDDFNGPRSRNRGPMPPFHRGHFKERGGGPLLPLPLPPPAVGTFQGECPLQPYERVTSPPPLGTPGIHILPPDYKVIEYIDRDPMKTIEIDGVSREIRFYGDTAIVMLDWESPKEIKFFPGSRRITFDNKDSLVLVFNEGCTKAEVDDQVFDIRFGAPTRELYINNYWYECYFGGPPTGIMIEGVPRIIQLEGPPPQVDIATEKRTDLVAGKINMIIDATHMFPVFLDAKPQKFTLHNVMHTIRFVDALKTVLLNEIPFKVEFGGLPKPIFFGGTKHFIRFSVLPRWVKPGYVKIADMEGRLEMLPTVSQADVIPGIDSRTTASPVTDSETTVNLEIVKSQPPEEDEDVKSPPMEVDKKDLPLHERVLSPDMENSNPGLDMLASVMPTSMAPLSQFSRYSLGSGSNNQIPGLDTPADEKPPNTGLPFFASINVNDLFAKLLATGIVPNSNKDDKETEVENEQKPNIKEDFKAFREDRNTIKFVNLLKPETLRVKQLGVVSRLYGGMQCCSCGARFPPEHTVRYSQHLDWHFRQNRRERDSARRAHSRALYYDLPDWVQYEEVEDLDDREKSWFETNAPDGATEVPVEAPEGEAPSVPAGAFQQQFCALCGDKFDQFYNEDKEEWHLRKAVCHEEKNYHPLCFEDFKASQTKAETKPEEIEDLENSTTLTEDEPSVILIDRLDTPIEIKDDTRSQSDAESVVEVLDEDRMEAVEIEEEGDDDVVLKAEPVEQLEVDDADTDDETQDRRTSRDKQAAIDFANVKVKLEPIDPDDEPVITAEEQAIMASADNTSHIVTSSIDGNVQLTSRPPTDLPSIRINISTLSQRPITTHITLNPEPIVDDEEPLPPGEEIELEYSLKPGLEGVEFVKKPPVQKGSELSGLCSIM